MAEISVVIPIFNGEEYLRESMDSILNQSFHDYEVILVCDNGTSQKSLDILYDYSEKDKRVRIIENTEKLGISESINVGIRNSSGKYIARMDGDDISAYRRLEVQKLYMDTYENIGICGIKHKVLNSPKWFVDFYSDPRQIKSDLLFFVPLRHPSIMIRGDVIFGNSLFYDKDLPGVEDYDYFIRAAKVTDLTNINDSSLFKYRRSNINTSLINKKRDEIIRKELMKRQFSDLLELDFDDAALEILDVVDGVSEYKINEYKKMLIDLEKAMTTIIEANDLLEVYDKKCLMNTLYHCWFRVKYSMDICSHNKTPDDAIEFWRDSRFHTLWLD